MTKIQDFHENFLKIEKNSYKDINIYNIGYVNKKYSKYVNILSVNPSFFIVDKEEGFIQEK